MYRISGLSVTARWLLIGLVGACAAAPPAGRDPWLERFAAAARFVPSGMTSLWFSEPCGGDGLWLEPTCRVVRCASSFAVPQGFGVGPVTGLVIEDHADVVSVTRLADLGERSEPIGAVAVWHRPPRAGPGPESAPEPEQWSAVVADRFVVTASSVALLRAALAQPAADLLVDMGELPRLPADTVIAVFRLAPNAIGSSDRDEARLSPRVCVLAASPLRVIHWTRTPIASELDWPARRVDQPPYCGMEARAPAGTDAALWYATMQLAEAFGVCIVI